jgi:hypothetical protein
MTNKLFIFSSFTALEILTILWLWDAENLKIVKQKNIFNLY